MGRVGVVTSAGLARNRKCAVVDVFVVAVSLGMRGKAGPSWSTFHERSSGGLCR
jgi:hypothetical protein